MGGRIDGWMDGSTLEGICREIGSHDCGGLEVPQQVIHERQIMGSQ
jgi:hypothetical protein